MTLIESIDTTRLIKPSHAEPIRSKLSWHECWEGPDSRPIKNWEIGRKLAIQNPDLAAQTRAGELPPQTGKVGAIERWLNVKNLDPCATWPSGKACAAKISALIWMQR